MGQAQAKALPVMAIPTSHTAAAAHGVTSGNDAASPPRLDGLRTGISTPDPTEIPCHTRGRGCFSDVAIARLGAGGAGSRVENPGASDGGADAQGTCDSGQYGGKHLNDSLPSVVHVKRCALVNCELSIVLCQLSIVPCQLLLFSPMRLSEMPPATLRLRSTSGRKRMRWPLIFDVGLKSSAFMSACV